MTVELVRDIVIIAFGTIAVVAIVLWSILALPLYLRARRILGSAQAVSKTAERFVSFLADQDALTKIVLIIQGIRQGFGSASQFFKGGEKQ
jgi:hypothetical protein